MLEEIHSIVDRLLAIEPLLTMSMQEESLLTKFLQEDKTTAMEMTALSISLKFFISCARDTNIEDVQRAFKEMKRTSGFSVWLLLKDKDNNAIFAFFKRNIERLEAIYESFKNATLSTLEPAPFLVEETKTIIPGYQVYMSNLEKENAEQEVSEIFNALPVTREVHINQDNENNTNARVEDSLDAQNSNRKKKPF